MKKSLKGVDVSCVDWRKLNSILSKMPEDGVKKLLDEEKAGRRRATFMRRIHQRLTRLRAARERKEFM